jgi:hypothetical protein
MEGFLEAQGAKCDHRRTAEEGDPRAIEPQPGMRPAATPT